MIRICRCFATKVAFALLLFAGLVSTSRAAIIDDFSTPQGPLVDSASGAVSGPGIIGNSRKVVGGNFFEVADGVGTFSFFGSGNVMSLTYDGSTTLGEAASFPPVDLTDGGIATQFLLGISGVEGALSMAMGVRDADGNTAPLVFSAMFAPGVYAVPLATGLTDFTRINWVSATLFLSPLPSSAASVSIDFLCTGTLEAGCTTAGPVTPVPEPESWVLLAVVAAWLPWLARKRPAVSCHESVGVR